MERVTTIKDIAKLCGVAVSTVSRAINNHPDINEDTKKMIMDVIRKNNYVPNNSARNLKKTDTKCIAIIIKGLNNPFFSSMISSIEEKVKIKEYTLTIRYVNEDTNELDATIELIKERKIQGIIFLGGSFSDDKKLKQIEIPFVFCTASVDENIIRKNNYSYVAVDDFKESYKIIDYLCKLGHRDIAIITEKYTDKSIAGKRFLGYKRALLDNNIEYNPNLVFNLKDDMQRYTMKNGYIVANDMFKSNQKFTAIYAISDVIAIGVSKAIFENGKKIPDDYSVVGYDGLEIAKYYNPTITTIRQPIEKIANASIELLFDLINKNKDNQQKIFDGDLIIGSSTRSI